MTGASESRDMILGALIQLPTRRVGPALHAWLGLADSAADDPGTRWAASQPRTTAPSRCDRLSLSRSGLCRGARTGSGSELDHPYRHSALPQWVALARTVTCSPGGTQAPPQVSSGIWMPCALRQTGTSAGSSPRLCGVTRSPSPALWMRITTTCGVCARSSPATVASPKMRCDRPGSSPGAGSVPSVSLRACDPGSW